MTVEVEPWPIVLYKVKARPEGKKGTFVAHFDQNGKHCKKSLKTRRADVARKEAWKLENELQNNTGIMPTKTLLADAINEFLTAKAADGVKPRTDAKYRRELQEFQTFCAERGVPRLDRITDDLVLSYRDFRRTHNLLSPGLELHEKTVYGLMMNLKGFFTWATRKKYLRQNPLINLHPRKPPFRPAFCPDVPTVDLLIANTSGPLTRILKTLAYTGMRSGELQLLRRKDIDLAGNWIHVRGLKAKLTRIHPERKVPIHSKLYAALECQLAENSGAGDAPLFPSDSLPDTSVKDGLLNTKLLCTSTKRIAKSLEIPVGQKKGGMVVHSLRHFFETVAVNSNVPQRVIDSWLGHTSERSMAAVYYRLLDADSQKLMKQVNF